MTTTLIFQSVKPLFFYSEFGQRLNEGGPFFMYPLVVMLLAIIALLIKAFLKKESAKSIELVKSISLFALVWGFLGQMIGLIGAFDAIGSLGNVPPEVLAGGIKVSALSPTFGMVVFLIARLGVISFIGFKK